MPTDEDTMISITSRQNSLIKTVASLDRKSERDRSSLFRVEGSVLISEAAACSVYPEKLFFRSDREEELTGMLSGCLGAISEAGCELYSVTPEVYDRITTENAPEGVLGVYRFLGSVSSASKEAPVRLTCGSRFIILENIQDPGNLGSIIRGAAAFGTDRIIACGCADVYNDKTVRSSMGAVFKQPVSVVPDIRTAVAILPESIKNIYAAALSDRALSIADADLKSPCTVMIGNEGRGLTDEAKKLASAEVIIPMNNMESINAAMAATVFMYEMSRR